MVPGAPQTVEMFRVQTEEKLAGLRCPDHNQPPRLRITGTSLHEASLSITSCCAKLSGLANRAICTAGADAAGDGIDTAA